MNAILERRIRSSQQMSRDRVGGRGERNIVASNIPDSYVLAIDHLPVKRQSATWIQLTSKMDSSD